MLAKNAKRRNENRAKSDYDEFKNSGSEIDLTEPPAKDQDIGYQDDYDDYSDEDELLDEDEGDGEEAPKPKQPKEQKNNQDGVWSKFKAMPIWLKAAIVISIIAVVQILMEGGTTKTGSETIEQVEEQPITKESVQKEDTTLKNEELTKELASCLMATPLSVKNINGTASVFFGEQDTTGSIFCDRFKTGTPILTSSEGSLLYRIDVFSGDTKIATKSVSFMENLHPEYYLEGVDVVNPVNPAQRRTIAIGGEIAIGVVLSNIVISEDGQKVTYFFKKDGKEYANTVSRSIVM